MEEKLFRLAKNFIQNNKYNILVIFYVFFFLQRTCAFDFDTQVDTTIRITAQVSPNCSVETSDVIFHSYSKNKTSITAIPIVFNCLTKTNYSISINNTNLATDYLDPMTNGSHQLKYEIYKDSALTTLWKNGLYKKTSTGTSKVLTLYGVIPANQQVIKGKYSNNITLFITIGDPKNKNAKNLVRTINLSTEVK